MASEFYSKHLLMNLLVGWKLERSTIVTEICIVENICEDTRNKMNNKKYTTVGTVPKSIQKIV